MFSVKLKQRGRKRKRRNGGRGREGVRSRGGSGEEEGERTRRGGERNGRKRRELQSTMTMISRKEWTV